jgi:hypothetical protein
MDGRNELPRPDGSGWTDERSTQRSRCGCGYCTGNGANVVFEPNLSCTGWHAGRIRCIVYDYCQFTG